MIADQIDVLNTSETPPFPVNQDTTVDEMMRLRYRYLDLRRTAALGRGRIALRIAGQDATRVPPYAMAKLGVARNKTTPCCALRHKTHANMP